MRRYLIVLVLALLLVGCAKNTTPTYPNQVNAFDGTAYTSLTIAQGALNQAKQLEPQYPNLKSELNTAILAYNAALADYKAWHAAGATGSTAALAAEIAAVSQQVAAILQSMGVKL